MLMNAKFKMIFSLIVCMHLWLKGIDTLGFSAQTIDVIELKPSSNEKPNIITEWTIYNEYGFYNDSSYFHQTDEHEVHIPGTGIQIPRTGIYVLTLNLIFEHSDDRRYLEVAVQEMHRNENIFCKAIEQLNFKGTINLPCLSRLKQLTNLEIAVYNEKPITLLAGSTVGIQFLGNVGDTFSFVLPLTNSLKYSEMLGEFQFFNSFRVLSDLSIVTIPCPGIYLISITAVVNMRKNSYFEIAVNHEDILHNVTSQVDTSKTISFLQPLKLRKNDNITIKFENIDIMKNSLYSLVNLENTLRSGFSLPAVNIMETGDSVCSIVLENTVNNTKAMYYIHNTWSTKKDILQIREGGLYIFTLQLKWKTNGEEYSAVITSSDDVETDEIDLTTGLSSALKSQETTQPQTLKINGLLKLRQNSMISIKLTPCNSNTKLNSQSFISLTPVLTKSYTMTSQMAANEDVINFRGNNWKQLEKFKSSGKMFLDQYLKDQEFVVPSTGMYFVSSYVSIKTVDEKTQKVIMVLNTTLSNHTLYSIKLIKRKSKKLQVEGILSLKRGDVVRLYIGCKRSIQIVGNIYFQAAFMSNLENDNYLIAQKAENATTWTTRLGGVDDKSHTLKSPGNGVFLITYSIYLKYIDLESDRDKLVVRVYTEQEDIGLLSTTYVSGEEIEGQNDFTIELIDYLKLTRNDVIHISLTREDKSKSKISLIWERISCLLVSNAVMESNGFKTIQRAQRIFKFNNKLNVLENFQFSERSGGFKLYNTKVFGSSFVSVKPLTVLYHVTVHLEEVIGVFKLCIATRPKNLQFDISTPVVQKEKGSVTLTATGILHIAAAESIKILVFGDKIRTLVLCTRSSWSLMELSSPLSSEYRHVLAVGRSAPQTRSEVLPIGIYAEHITTYDRQIYHSLHFIKYQNSSSLSKNYNSTVGRDLFYLTRGRHLVTMLQQPRKTVGFDVKKLFESEELQNQRCLVTVVENIVPNTLIFRNIDRMMKIELPNQRNMSNFFAVAMCKTDKVKILLDKSVDSNKTVPVANFLALRTLDNIHGFSATILVSQTLESINGTTERVDGLVTSHHPFFDRTFGYKEGSGMFVAQENGFYFITINIAVQVSGNENSCRAVVFSDESKVLSLDILNKHIAHASVIWLQRNSALQLKFKCPDGYKVTIQREALISLLLIDSQPSFDTGCINVTKEAVLTNVNTSISHVALGRSFLLTCSSSSNVVGDFVWKKNGWKKNLTRGAREGYLSLTDLNFNDNGTYTCIMERGKFSIASKPVELIVIDPRPTLVLSNNTIYLDENLSNNKFVAWVEVHAVDMLTKEPADVKLTIIAGNDDDNFYFSSSHTKTFATLLHRKPFNFEARSSYQLTIKAETYNIETTGQTIENLTVNIKNRNEHKPEFTAQIQECRIRENSKVHTKVCTVSAIDADYDSNIRYNIYFTSHGDLFSINETSGDITVKDVLDYELANKINVIVTATDGLFTTYQHVTIFITDENDNKPIFEQQNYEVTIFDNVVMNTAFLKVAATDQDSGKYGEIVYKLLNNVDRFEVQQDGSLIMKQPLDNVDTPINYTLTIEAKDLGIPSLASECKVIVEVLSTNQTIVLQVVTTLPPSPQKRLSKWEWVEEKLKWWKFWAVFGAILLFLVLLVIIVVLCSKYRRSQKEIQEILDNQPDEADLEMKSFLSYSRKPAESVEACMSISCETLPSAYNSMKNLTQIDSTEKMPQKLYDEPYANGKPLVYEKIHLNGNAVHI